MFYFNRIHFVKAKFPFWANQNSIQFNLFADLLVNEETGEEERYQIVRLINLTAIGPPILSSRISRLTALLCRRANYFKEKCRLSDYLRWNNCLDYELVIHNSCTQNYPYVKLNLHYLHRLLCCLRYF